MTQEDTHFEVHSKDNEGVNFELSLLDILNFLERSWKKLAVAALVGALLGLVFGFFSTDYQVSMALRNNEGLGILSIKSFQGRLPNLASEILEKKQAPEGKEDLYTSMSSPDFWVGALTPVFAMTKADIKELGADIKGANNSILFLMIRGTGASKDAAIQNATGITQFFRESGAYIGIRDLFTAQQSEISGSQARIESKIHETLVEIEYQKNRLKSIEELGKRFPVDSRSSLNAFDPKYLPINTQIIAINSDISNSKEALSRLKAQQAELDQVGRWLEFSAPRIEKNFNGLELNKELLVLEEKFRGEIKSDYSDAYTVMDGIRATLLSNSARFQFGLVQDGTPITKKSGMLKFIVGGLVGALFLMLLSLLGQKVWVNIKSGDNK